MRNSVVKTIIERARVDKNIVFLTGDLGYNCLEPFIEEFPDRFFNCGIAEQNMLALAAGLAFQGKKVFMYSIANFDTLRAIEQIRNNACYMNLDVNIIAVGAGLEYGQLGFSHQATEDVSCLRSLPNMSVFDPANVDEAIACTNKMLETTSPCYLRLNKKGVEIKTKVNASLQPYMVKKGEGVALLSSGVILGEALKASELLAKKGLNVAVYSCPAVKPINKKAFIKEMLNYQHIYTLEEQMVCGGFGSMVAETLASQKQKPVQDILGIQDFYEDTIGGRDYLRKEYKIDAESVAKHILKTL